MLPFAITNRDPESAARAGELTTPHGVVRTPAFMPVGTAGTVKGVAAWELDRLAPEIILANTYHLLLRPGIERLERLGGLHRLMGWPGPILTDSGGYQVHSLATRRRVDDDGVTFSRTSTAAHRLDPESAVDAQIGSESTSRWCSTSACPTAPTVRPWSAPPSERSGGRCAGCARR
jgi:queuine tRNA-ribosyltransferase